MREDVMTVALNAYRNGGRESYEAVLRSQGGLR